MIKLNDTMNHPLRFIYRKDSVIGQFYNSLDKKYHLSEYIPYEQIPSRYLCGKTGNFSSSRREDDDRNICKECFKILEKSDD